MAKGRSRYFDEFTQKEPWSVDALRPCYCVGPQNGGPVCPCRMKFVQIKNGRYVETRDLGPVPDPGETK